MKIYNCDICGEMVYFENDHCVSCGSPLGYLPLLDNMSSMESTDGFVWKALAPSAHETNFKKCQNYWQQGICNWMVPITDPNTFCLSCRLNKFIPDPSHPQNKHYWHRLEIAKRRLVYSLLQLDLPLHNKADDPENGLEFCFLASKKNPQIQETEEVLTGYEHGTITINIAEANDAVREKMRLDMNERYRTLLGHFRHEIGHYYWWLLVHRNEDLLKRFRDLFGDERVDYDEALQKYYAGGAPVDWQNRHVSAYASAHPWEDWAESWAHYLHMFDTLETAGAWGMIVKFIKGKQRQSIHLEHRLQTFEEMRNQWVYLSCALNSLNRSMGMTDVYPFVWTETIIEKLRFIQQVIIQSAGEL
ncbi:MAG: putative zinc-binding peptidase [Candidatus Omnitrophica bacterium]|nr:putative zinc-binding peptidase [Candidatus Omnitrophota bacterium]